MFSFLQSANIPLDDITGQTGDSNKSPQKNVIPLVMSEIHFKKKRERRKEEETCLDALSNLHFLKHSVQLLLIFTLKPVV